MHGRAVSPVRAIPAREALHEPVLIDPAILAQVRNEGARHLRVIGIAPGRVAEDTLRDETVDMVWIDEVALAERAPS